MNKKLFCVQLRIDCEELIMVTIREIANKAGYSAATVSRLLNNDPTFSIAEQTKNKILQVAMDLGYTGHDHQLPVRSIAIFFGITPKEELEDVYYNGLRKSLKSSAEKLNMQISFYNNVSDLAPLANPIDGFIAVGNFKNETLKVLNNLSHNGIFIDSNPNPAFFSSVQPDIEAITIDAINQFRHCGYRNIGFIGGSYFNPNTNLPEMDQRERIFRNYLFELGLLQDKYIFSTGHFSVNTGYDLGQRVIAQLDHDLPEGFFIASDPIAVGVLQAFNEHGITVPKDTSIISVNNIDISKYVSPPLTTYDINLNELSRTAIELLNNNLLTRNKNHRRILIHSDLVIRRSFIPLN